MSDTPQIEPTDQVEQANIEPTEPTDSGATDAPETTVGTGTAMALGCIAGTMVLIVFGLIFLFFATVK